MVSDGPLAGFLRVGLPPYGVGVVVANPPVSEAGPEPVEVAYDEAVEY